MKKKIIGIFVCMLLILGVIPITSSTAENKNTYPSFVVSNSGERTYGHIPIPEWVERTELPEPTEALLVDLDWRSNGGDYTTPAKDQQQCGSCWCFTAIGALESAVEIANSNPGMNPDLSEQYPLSCTGAQGICPNDCVSGGNAYWAFWYMGTAAPQNGGLPEACFPYQAVDANGCDFNGCGYTPVLCSAKCATWQSQLVQTITGYGFDDASGSGTLTPQKIKNQLANGPVCLSIDVFADFNPGPGTSPSFDGNGIYRWDGVSAYTGGHAILCVGYSDSLGAWICKNSWGAGWGNMQGFFLIAYGQCNIEYDMSWVTFTQTGSNNPPNTPSNPSPANHATGVDVNADLSWTGGDPDAGDTVTYDLYFDTATPPTLANTGLTSASFDPGTMSSSTKYYWQIVSWDNHGASTAGPIWDFTTAGGTNNPPNAPSNPSPSNHATGLDVNADLSWTCSDPDTGDTLTYDVYLGTTTSPSLVSSGQASSSYDPGTMNPGTKYYWKIDAWDNHGATTPGPLWDFTTASGSNNPPTTPSKPNGPTTGVPGVPYRYTTSATDPDSGDQIKYGWDFDGDGIVDSGHWTGFYASGATCNLDVTFGGAGTYYLSVIAEDNHGAQSAFSPTLTVVISSGTNNPPTVSITSPLDGATVSGTIPIQGTASDSDGTVTQVQVKIDSGSWWTASGTTSWSTNFDTTTVSDGSHTIYAQSKDDQGAYSTVDSVTVTVNNGGTNNPPNQPTTPTGQTTSCKVNTPYPYYTSATDSDPGDKLKYGWDWTGDGVVDKWDDNNGNYYIPGTQITTQITWTAKKTTYSLKVIAEDLNGAQSPWSLPLSVTTPRNRAINTPIFNFLQNHPILFQLLQRFLKL